MKRISSSSESHGRSWQHAKAMLPDRFSQAIDAAAMVEGDTATMAYLESWQWGPEEERPGTAHGVVEILLAELDEAYPQIRLADMIRGRKS